MPPRTVYPIGAGRFAALVESADLVFDGDTVRAMDHDDVLRVGQRVKPEMR